MTRIASRHRAGMAVVGALAAVSLVMVACSVEPPAQSADGIEEIEAPPDPETNDGVALGDLPIRTIPIPPRAPAAEPDPVSTPEGSAETTPAAAPADDRPEPTVSLAISQSPSPPSEPAFTPMEVRPRLQNASVLAQALQQNYPMMLKDAGVEGTTTLWIHLGTDGTVDDVRVFESSGYPQFDQVAMNVMRGTAAFTPAEVRETATAVWIQVPVVFQLGR